MAPVMCREWSADSFAGAVLNAGGTAEHDSIQSVFENDGNEFFTHSRIVSRPGICNSIPGRFFISASNEPGAVPAAEYMAERF